MPVPSEDNTNDVTAAISQEFDSNNCNAMASHTSNSFRSFPSTMAQDMPLHSELYWIHVNPGDSFSVPQPDGSMQNITGPVAVPLYVSNGVPPPISAPPGYMLHFAEEGGGKHVRILPLVAPAVLDHPNSYVGPSMPHPHQSSIQMPGMSPVQPLYYPNMVPNSNYYQQPVVYPEDPRLSGGYCYRVQAAQSLPTATTLANSGRICTNATFQAAVNPQSSCGTPASRERVAVFDENVKPSPFSTPVTLQMCTCDTCQCCIGSSNLDNQASMMNFRDNTHNNAVGFVLNSIEVCTSNSDTAYSSASTKSIDEMSDNSFTSTSASQSVTPPSGPASGSSIHSHVPDSKEWERGAPEHLHPEQSASSGSPTRTSSSMASSSPSVSSMTSSPRHSPSLIPTNGHKGSRSPMRQSPASKSFLPPAQAQMPGFTSHSLHHHRDLQVPDNVLHLDKENLSVHSNTHLPEEPKLMASMTELLGTVAKPEVRDIAIRKVRVFWSSLSLENSGLELGEKVENCGITFCLQLAESKKNFKFSSVYSGVDLECTLENLRPGLDYSVKLQASCGKNSGPFSDVTSFRTLSTVPDIPIAPKLQKATKDSIHLKWVSPYDNGEKIMKYYLECDDGTEPDSFRQIYSGTSKNFKVLKLLPFHPYAFRLAAENKIGRSEWSPCITHYTSGVPPSTPDPPKLEQAAISYISLTWFDPVDDAVSFTLEMNDESTGYGFRPVYNGSRSSFCVKNLARMTNYKFRLKAANNFGSSNYSQVVVYGTNPDKPLAPGKPHVKGSVHAYSVTLAWDSPRDDGGSLIVGYKVEKAIGDNPFTDVVHDGPNKECHVKDLEPGQLFRFRVISKTDKDTSSPSGILSITTRPVLPGPSPTPSLALRPKPNCVTIKWDLPEYTGGAEITNYEVNWMPVSDGSDAHAQIGYTGNKAECTIGELSPGTAYSFAVRAANQIGFGGWSDRLQVVTGPGSPSKPDIPEATVLNSHSIRLDWQAPLTNGADITKYSLQWGSTEAALSQISTKGPVLSHEFNCLTPNTTYFFSIQALNSVGPSSSSDVGSATTLSSCPERVSNLRLTPDNSENPQPSVTAHRILITWDAPRDNGSKVVAYKVNISSDDASNTTHHIETNSLTFDAVGLLPDTDYRFKVCAVNGLGTGPFSSVFLSHTRPLPPDAPHLECIQYAYNSLKLQWNCGSKDTFGTQYLLQKILKKESGKRLQTVHRGPEKTCLVNGLSELTTYSFRICAINSEGQGPFSTEHFTTTIQAPAAMKSPVVRNIKATECHVLWQKCNKIKGDSIYYRLTLEKHGKVLIEKDLDDTKYVLSKLAPHTTYHLSVAAVRYLTRKDLSSTSTNDSLAEVDVVTEPDANSEISGPVSSPVELFTKGSPSNVVEEPSLAVLVVQPPGNPKEFAANSEKISDHLPKPQENTSPLAVVRKAFLDVLHDDNRLAHRQVVFFYICAILFAILTSWIYI